MSQAIQQLKCHVTHNSTKIHQNLIAIQKRMCNPTDTITSFECSLVEQVTKKTNLNENTANCFTPVLFSDVMHHMLNNRYRLAKPTAKYHYESLWEMWTACGHSWPWHGPSDELRWQKRNFSQSFLCLWPWISTFHFIWLYTLKNSSIKNDKFTLPVKMWIV